MDKANTHNTGKPLQTISWAEKHKDNGKWFELTAEYYLGLSRFGPNRTKSSNRDLEVLYNVYNGKFPESWFSMHTNPLNAQNAQHKKFPAKIRPVPILRTNLDLLMGEYPRRPFIYHTTNLSDWAYNSYSEAMQEQVYSNLMQHFQLKLQQNLMAQGVLTPDGQPASEEAMAQIEEAMNSLELPEKVKERFAAGYKDATAIKGQKWLKRIIVEKSVRAKLNKCFKHWVIAGETYSYKTIQHGELIYKPISPLMLDYDKSDTEDFIEDGEWVVYRELITVSDAVNELYDELSKAAIDDMENHRVINSPQSLYSTLSSIASETGRNGMLFKDHIVWVGKKKVGILTYLDPETNQLEQMEVDEDYKPIEEESVEWIWINEVYEATKIADKFYRKRAYPFQRSSMNNISKTKLPYNGRRMSDTHSENISVTELGLPIQIMYIIVTYALERTIAKSKGKIAIIDKGVIPMDEGWDEEKFFYYSEALGYAVINRNQIGVDKSFNQYQVLDMTLFDSIKQLIELQQHLKSEWDDLLGISRQRKGQTYASDLVGVNERATFQSTVITDMIFNLFEEWVEKELQGLLDLTKFLAVDGVYKMWNDDELGNEILEVDPGPYCSADLGLYVQNSSEIIAKKNKLEQYITPMIQGQQGIKPSTVLKMLSTDSISEMRSMLMHVEEIESKVAQQTAQSQQEAEQAQLEIQQSHAEFMELLKRETMDLEYDRKEDIEHIKGTYNTFTFQDGDANDNGVPDATEVMKLNQDLRKFQGEMNDRREQRNHETKLKVMEAATKMADMKSKERIAKSRPKPKTKK